MKRFMTLLLVALLALPALAGMLPAGATPVSPDGIEMPAETASLVDPRLALMAAAPERIGELGGAVFACSHSLAERGIVPALKVREALAPQRVSQAIARGWQVISG